MSCTYLGTHSPLAKHSALNVVYSLEREFYQNVDIAIDLCRIISQLGPNVFQGTCNASTLSGLSGLSSLQILDFTASGLSGTIPASWATGAWNQTLQSVTLSQNPNLTGPVPNFAK